jgi:hypothetical protein
MFFAGGVGTSMADPVFGPQFEISTGCGANKAQVMELIGGDYPQDSAWQDQRWELMKATYPGLVDSDRLGNATWTYNCHSNIFNNSQYWLNDPSPYKGTGSGCYEEDPNGTIRSEGTRHSCTVDYVGKCGSEFLMKRNELVYGSVNPIYKKSVASIPTLSQWKKIFLTLIMLSLVMGFMRIQSPKLSFPNGGSLNEFNISSSLIFEPKLYMSVLKWVGVVVVLGLSGVTVVFNHVSILDIFGTLFCMPLVAYILHLVFLFIADFERTS